MAAAVAQSPDIPLVIVVAVADNGVIGASGGLPWHLTEDLKQVKKLTLGKPLIMGRRTYQSIGRPLPGRVSVVLTSDPGFSVPGVIVVRDFEAALEAAHAAAVDMTAREIVAFGGAGIYARALPLAKRIYKTEVHARPDGDTWFPDTDPGQWREVAREDHRGAGPDGLSYSLVVLDRLT